VLRDGPESTDHPVVVRGLPRARLDVELIDVLIGELGVVDLASYEPPAQITPSPPSGSTLTWTDPTASTTQYYNVWAVRGGSCAQLVGRSTLLLYDLEHPLFGIPDGGEQFIVQPVSTSGLAAPLSLPPC
jgi:hypothetical protein